MPVPHDRSPLTRLVDDVDAFVAGRWATTPLLTRTPGAGAFDDLLSLDDVDRALAASGLRQPAFRLVQDGRPLSPARYTTSARIGSRVVDDVADVGRVHALFDGGATIVLQGLQRWWEPLTRYCRSLELVVGHTVQANAYVTPADAQGLGRHEDLHDVFLLQVLGTKHWQVHAPGAPAADDPLLDTELEPGDTLYLPAGSAHSARTMKTPSIHITLGVLTTSWSDVVRDVLAGAPAELGLGERLPFGFTTDQADAGFRRAAGERLRALAGWLDDLDAGEVVSAARERTARRRPPLLVGQLHQLLAIDAIDDRSVLRRRPGVVVEVAVGEDTVDLIGGDRVVHLPARLEAVVRLVLSQEEVTGADLVDHLDETGRAVLLRRLVREGILEVL